MSAKQIFEDKIILNLGELFDNMYYSSRVRQVIMCIL